MAPAMNHRTMVHIDDSVFEDLCAPWLDAIVIKGDFSHPEGKIDEAASGTRLSTYEGFHRICSTCGCYGRSPYANPITDSDNTINMESCNNGESIIPIRLPKKSTDDDDTQPLHGDWMVVRHKNRKKNIAKSGITFGAASKSGPSNYSSQNKRPRSTNSSSMLPLSTRGANSKGKAPHGDTPPSRD
ncbi:hypothetical protein JHK87_028110 [Glycine soja]|nr:hypothetical protein JHK87_028110 [Glycine soja]